MEMKQVWAVYWSPTGATRRVVTAVADTLAARLGAERRELDCTLPAAREAERRFGPEDVVVLGTPTYAGRVPNKLLPYLQTHLEGGGALAVPVVLFGNRSYDNSLAELCAELEAHGFHRVSAAAFVGRHAFSDALAAGRPDGADLELAAAFAARTADKVAALTGVPAPVEVPGDPTAPYYTPLGADGQPAKFLKAKPKTDSARCTACGLCAALCPMGAIDPGDVSSVPGACIKCQACVRGCPAGAKFFDDPAFLSHVAMLEAHYAGRRAEAELFL